MWWTQRCSMQRHLESTRERNVQTRLTKPVFTKYLMARTTLTITYSTLKARKGQRYWRVMQSVSDLKSLFGKNKIGLDCHGDSMPMYAIYQLQTQRLTYKFFFFKLGILRITMILTEKRNMELQHWQCWDPDSRYPQNQTTYKEWEHKG